MIKGDDYVCDVVEIHIIWAGLVSASLFLWVEIRDLKLIHHILIGVVLHIGLAPASIWMCESAGCCGLLISCTFRYSSRTFILLVVEYSCP